MVGIFVRCFCTLVSYLSLKVIQRGRPYYPHFLDRETEFETVMPQASREWSQHLNLDQWSVCSQVMVGGFTV